MPRIGPIHPLRTIPALWRCRWNVVRLLIASFLLWTLAADTGGRLARRQLAALPDFDYLAEIRFLKAAGRYGEALSIADAGIDATKDEPDSSSIHLALLSAKDSVERERSSWLRRAKDAGMGALTGSAGTSGDASLERLAGAVAADLFVVGDVRDLVIQGGRFAIDGETDEVIVALSTLGLFTTLAPEIDWVPALLKIARKAGSMSRGLQEFIVTAVKSRRAKEVQTLASDVGSIARHSSPASAVRLLRTVDDPADAARLARFLERHAEHSRGAFALHVGGDEAAALLKSAEKTSIKEAAAMGEALVKVSKKGRPGIRWLSTPAARAILRPHPLIGLAKGLWKENVSELIRRGLDAAGPHAWWILPLVAAWVVAELGLLMGRFNGLLGHRPNTPTIRESKLAGSP